MNLSLVLPAFDAAPFIGASVATLLAFLRDRSARLGSFEILVVDDGSRDRTSEIVARAGAEVSCLRLPRNLGKGAAVRHGMLAARGTQRIFVDCDLPYALDAIESIDAELRAGADVCIGDRGLPDSSFQNERSCLRRLGSAGFTVLVSRILLPGFRDTQCGIKGLRGEVADRLFPRCTIDGFAFDVELLYLARQDGLRISRIPVRSVGNAPSSIRILRDPLRALLDTLRIPSRHGSLREPACAPAAPSVASPRANDPAD